ncbi:fatty acyl-AMP ligase [Nannocystis sp.]|uniref:fatty acyl-AMP ligase n=1 Tax=Nannocystis sp. TaxID=1962667 RepID=UPI0025F79BC7|nr:fatty acyl-AMP ligase [Nannocystis sp.]MBK7825446.1 fatty acyl-AMP ligase [Nannocystis sp.]
MTAGVTTLTAALAAVAGHESTGYSHLRHEQQPPVFLSYAEMWRRAQRSAAALQAMGVRRGDRVGLILPDSAEFIDDIFGAMLAGAIAVPVYPPMNLGQFDSYLANTTHILRQAGCSVVITDAQVRPILGKLMSGVPELRVIETHAAAIKAVPVGAEPAGVTVGPDDVAFLQFTSGSTSRPKGVTLTHANLMANIAAIGGGAGLQISRESSGLSWLPLYHDMGLIGFVFAPIVYGVRSIRFIPPLMFLKRPSIWLRQLSETGAEITFAPNFAYGLCTTRVKDSELVGVDLSRLRVAGCGAEPIQHGTLRAFADRFAPFGFRGDALLPCYGMAEHSLAVTFGEVAGGLKADRVDAAALALGRAEPAGGDEAPALAVVCCGRAFAEHGLRIVDDAGEPLAERQVGHIELRGPSVMRGYWNDPERTAEALHAGWLRTGDLGYLADGELYVCGRSKDLIIINGRNYHPQDLEWQASQVEGVRRGNVIAFGIHDPALGREYVVVAAELRQGEAATEAATAALAARVQAQILEALALRVDEVVLLPPGSLPKTSSGKLQRSKGAEMFARGELGDGVGPASKLGLLRHLAASRWGFIKAALGGTKRGE